MRSTHSNKDVIDLHGLTREESLVIVREALEERALHTDRECSTFSLLLDSMYIGLYLRIYTLLFRSSYPTAAAQREAPLRIITGRGNHSAGKVSILGPFLTNTLKAEGWSVHKIDGGIVVNNRTRND